MLNSSVIFNNLYIANVMIFTIKIKKFSLYVSLLFHKRYSKGGRDTEQQFHRAWYVVSLTNVYGNGLSIWLSLIFIFCTCLGVDEKSRNP